MDAKALQNDLQSLGFTLKHFASSGQMILFHYFNNFFHLKIQCVSKVTPDFIQLKSQWIFFYDIFYIYAFSNYF